LVAKISFNYHTDDAFIFVIDQLRRAQNILVYTHIHRYKCRYRYYQLQ